MFVTNHVLSGVVVGRLLERHPVAAFVVGVGSHLALDMVPHWGCEADRAMESDLFFRYARRDGLLGLATAACAVEHNAPGAPDRPPWPPLRARCSSTWTSPCCTSGDVSRFPTGSNGFTVRSRTSRRRACRTRSSSGCPAPRSTRSSPGAVVGGFLVLRCGKPTARLLDCPIAQRRPSRTLRLR